MCVSVGLCVLFCVLCCVALRCVALCCAVVCKLVAFVSLACVVSEGKEVVGYRGDREKESKEARKREVRKFGRGKEEASRSCGGKG